MIGFFGKKMLLTQHVNYLLRGVTKKQVPNYEMCDSVCYFQYGNLNGSIL